jgi:UDP-N-acetylglucosamine 2-epimerase
VRIVSVVGARPQFIKAAPLLRALRASHTSLLVHTGQHYDANMSRVFFDELALPEPDHHLGVGSGRHGAQTGEMIARLETVFETEHADWVIVFGDTNSTLAGALAASKLYLPIAHVEAGLRSFNRAMPEEINRIVADALANLLLCPTETAVGNLQREGMVRGVHQVGDLMAESLADACGRATSLSRVLQRLELAERQFVVATVHRAENTGERGRLEQIVRGLETARRPVIFPVHPRTRAVLADIPLSPASPIRLIEPVGYLDMVRLLGTASVVATDSGGIQKEAYWLGTPCVTLRDQTEWVETVAAGWNTLVGADTAAIAYALAHVALPASRPDFHQTPPPSQRIVELLSAS